MAYILWAYFYAGSILFSAYLRLSQYTANIVFRSNCTTGEIMLAKLPQPVVNYLAAVTAKDTDMFARCFTDDALVHDEGRDYRGIEAITAWKTETQTKYKYVIEPLDALVSGNTVKLRARLTGDFPRTPAALDFVFMLAHEKIASLEIG